MVNILTPPGLEGLFDLDRKGVDIKPTLLRVLTDQYLRSAVHSPEETTRYTELALRLIDETDMATRAAIAARLAPHACAPRSVILQLARDMPDIAEPVLLHSPCLTPADCEAIIAERGPVYADILARRGRPPVVDEPDPRQAPTVMARSEQARVEQAPANPSGAKAQPGPDARPAGDTGTDRDTDVDARELCELFFAAGSPERRLILLNLDFASWPAQAPPSALQRSDIWRMETAALRHNTATVMRELERALGISYRLSRRIVEDDLGEPIVAAAKAMALPADVVQRILLFMNPRVGQSVDRVYELSELYREISIDGARRLVAILRASEQPGRKPAVDSRAMYAAAEAAQRALSEVSRAPVRVEPSMPRAAGSRER